MGRSQPNVLRIENVEISEIKVRENWNSRSKKQVRDVNTLICSMQEIGLQQPIVINDKGFLVAGYRRLTAAKKLEWKTIPASIVEFPTEYHERLIHIDENLESMSLNEKDLEKALLEKKQIYEILYPSSMKRGPREEGREDEKSFIEDTAEKSGLNHMKIRRLIKRAEEVSGNVREAYENERINSGQVDCLVRLTKEDQDKILEKIVGLSRAETDMIVNDIIKHNKENEPKREIATERDMKLVNAIMVGDKVIKAVKRAEVLLEDFILSGKIRSLDKEHFDALKINVSQFINTIKRIPETIT
jgi:ParB-like chromosome segregation protein Spo0J